MQIYCFDVRLAVGLALQRVGAERLQLLRLGARAVGLVPSG